MLISPQILVRTKPQVVGAASYAAQGVNFDGTNDYLTRGAALTGAADSKVGICSFWLNYNGTDNAQAYLMDAPSAFILTKQDDSSGNCVQLLAAGFQIWIRSGAVLSGAGWKHVLFSWDNAASASHRYLNDVSGGTTNGQSNANVPWTAMTDCAIGATVAGANKQNMDIADFYLNTATYLDFSVTGNRRKFISAGGTPVDLGSDGSTPTGSAPIIFQHGAVSGWETNDGTGGGFTLTGALTASATNP